MAKTRNVILAVGCSVLGLVALCAGVVGLCGYFLFQTVAENPFLNDTLDRAFEHPAVIEELGEPIEMSWTQVQLHTDFGGDESGRVEVTIRGPRGSGRLEARGERASAYGAWDYDYLRVELDDGGSIDLLRE